MIYRLLLLFHKTLGTACLLPLTCEISRTEIMIEWAGTNNACTMLLVIALDLHDIPEPVESATVYNEDDAI